MIFKLQVASENFDFGSKDEFDFEINALHLDTRAKFGLNSNPRTAQAIEKSGSKQNLVLILVQRPIELNSIEGQNEASYSDLRIKLDSNFSFKLGPQGQL